MSSRSQFNKCEVSVLKRFEEDICQRLRYQTSLKSLIRWLIYSRTPTSSVWYRKFRYQAQSDIVHRGESPHRIVVIAYYFIQCKHRPLRLKILKNDIKKCSVIFIISDLYYTIINEKTLPLVCASKRDSPTRFFISDFFTDRILSSPLLGL